MSNNRSAGDQIAQRIREAILSLHHNNERVTKLVDTQQENSIHALRTLARSRVSSILRQLRATSGFSYEDVSAKTGLTKQLLFDVEYKERRLTLDELRKLAAAYEIGIDDILGVDLE